MELLESGEPRTETGASCAPRTWGETVDSAYPIDRYRQLFSDPKLFVPLRRGLAVRHRVERVSRQPFLGGLRLVPVADPPGVWVGRELRITSETYAAVLRFILKVKDGAGGGYWWVECGTCECG
jgi:hypothetical protein